MHRANQQALQPASTLLVRSLVLGMGDARMRNVFASRIGKELFAESQIAFTDAQAMALATVMDFATVGLGTRDWAVRCLSHMSVLEIAHTQMGVALRKSASVVKALKAMTVQWPHPKTARVKSLVFGALGTEFVT